ncbi:MAG: DUF3830 family protein [Verrucomicrobiae bacterium]|nr:DUF3830 family protein [Verrucomicrobiae bacterium]
MAKEIELIFPECDNRTLVAVLHEERAPVSCKKVWDWLEKPVEELVGSRWPGFPELYVWVPAMPGLPYENATSFPKAGDLLLAHHDLRGGNYTSPEGRVMAFDLGIFYAPSYLYLPVEQGYAGWVSANHVGTLRDVREMAPIVARQLLGGKQKIILRRKTS